MTRLPNWAALQFQSADEKITIGGSGSVAYFLILIVNCSHFVSVRVCWFYDIEYSLLAHSDLVSRCELFRTGFYFEVV